MAETFRAAVRSIQATRSASLIVVLLIGLGIGGCTVLYALADAVVFRPLPLPESHRLVSISTPSSLAPDALGTVAPQNFFAWRDQSKTMDLSAIGPAQRWSFSDPSSEPVVIRATSPELFSVLGVRAELGTVLGTEHQAAGGNRVGVVSYELWRNRLGSDPFVLGRRLEFTQGDVEVIGVMPPGFAYPPGLAQPTSIWVLWKPRPTDRQVESHSRSYSLNVVGRLRPGKTVDEARAEVENIDQRVRSASPGAFRERFPTVLPLQDAVARPMRSWMLLMLGAMAALLIIACVNVANVLTVRAMARQDADTIRVLLGATRRHLVGVVVTETAILVGLATSLAVAASVLGVRIARAALPADVPRLGDAEVNVRVLSAVAIVSALVTLATALLPSLRTSAVHVPSRPDERAIARLSWLKVLVTAQVAIVSLLVVAAGLFAASFLRVATTELGVDLRGVTAHAVRFPAADPPDSSPGLNAVHVKELLARVKALPGVESAALVTDGLPLAGGAAVYSLTIPGVGTFDGPLGAGLHQVSTGYFHTMRIALRKGRLLQEADTAGSPGVAALSESAARLYFGEADPLGATIRLWGERTIVAVVADVRLQGPEGEIHPAVYVPITQAVSNASSELVVRGVGDLRQQVQMAVNSVLPDSPKRAPRSLPEMYRALIAQRRLNMAVLGLFGGVAVVLASLGVYGVMTTAVAQRMREIGVRKVLGASNSLVFGSVLKGGLTLLGIGLSLGLSVAAVLADRLDDYLFGVSGRDPVVFAAAAMLMAFVGLCATFPSALKASRVAPSALLREYISVIGRVR